MKVARTGLIAAAILAVATVAWAQRPDFSGTWTLDTEASGMPAGAGGGAPGGGGGGRMGGGRGGGAGLGQGGTVRQTADTLTVERMAGDNKLVLNYKLDGSESRNTVMGRGGQIEAVSVARWDGQTLVITTKQDMGGQTFESTQRWSLSGNALTVETSNARGTTKMVYRKG